MHRLSKYLFLEAECDFENFQIHVEICCLILMSESPQSDHIGKQLSLMSTMFIMSTQLSSIYQVRHYHV